MGELVTRQRFFQDGGGSRKGISDTAEIIQDGGGSRKVISDTTEIIQNGAVFVSSSLRPIS